MQMTFSCRTTGWKDLSYFMTNDITTCNNDEFWLKSVNLYAAMRIWRLNQFIYVFFYDFPSFVYFHMDIH